VTSIQNNEPILSHYPTSSETEMGYVLLSRTRQLVVTFLRWRMPSRDKPLRMVSTLRMGASQLSEDKQQLQLSNL